MYKFIRKILFLSSAEAAHNFTVKSLKLLHYLPFSSKIIRFNFEVKSPMLKREVFNLTFKNPVGLAAGLDKNAEVYNELSDFGFSFIEIGTITREAQPGNEKPRLFRIVKDHAFINRMGFNNVGVKKAIENLQKKRRKGLIIGGNIGKNTNIENEKAASEYEKTFSALYNHVDYFTVNVSCPNVANLQSLQSVDNLKNILGKIVETRRFYDVYKPVLLKISPDLTFAQIDETLALIRTLGIDGIVATNTTTSRTELTIKPSEIESIGNGGLSGAPLTKRSIEIVKYINEKTGGQLPIIGVGGIMTEDDAVEMLRAGARLIQIYSGFVYEGPAFVKRINTRILNEMRNGRN